MNKLQIFESPEFGAVRTVEIDGDPWLVGKDVAEALGYGGGKSLANAIARHVDPEDKGVTEMMTPGGRAGEQRAGLRRELDIQHQPRPAGCVQTGDIGHSPTGRPGRNHPGCHAQWAIKNRPPRWREDGRHRKIHYLQFKDMLGGCQDGIKKIHTGRIRRHPGR